MTPHIVRLILSNRVIGDGTTDDPFRKLQCLHTLTGDLILEFDPHTCKPICTPNQGIEGLIKKGEEAL